MRQFSEINAHFCNLGVIWYYYNLKLTVGLIHVEGIDDPGKNCFGRKLGIETYIG